MKTVNLTAVISTGTPTPQLVHVYKGEDVLLNFTTAPPAAVANLVFTLVNNMADAGPLVQRTPTTIDGVNGLFSVTLSRTDLTIAPAYYDWDCWITTPLGERVVAIGTLTVKQEVYTA